MGYKSDNNIVTGIIKNKKTEEKSGGHCCVRR